ncbi:MAG: ExbD/TolR family protein [Verrucomicrobiales bacterium]
MKFRKTTQLEAMGIQIAPLVDVLILLLAFFIITWKFSRFETEIDISLPAAEKGQPLSREYNEIIVNVHQDGRVVVDSQDYDEDKLQSRLSKIARINPNVAVIVRGDRITPYEHIVHVLDSCKKSGVWNVSFMTVRPENQR